MQLKTILSVVVFCCHFNFIFNQNLLLNGSFEDTAIEKPCRYNNLGYYGVCDYWFNAASYNPPGSSVDYSCPGTVPAIFPSGGFPSGTGALRLVAGNSTSSSKFSEAVTTSLTHSIPSGTTINLSFRVRRSGSNTDSPNIIFGIYLYSYGNVSEADANSTDHHLTANPQIIIPTSTIPTFAWGSYSTTFTTTLPISKMAIGFFNPSSGLMPSSEYKTIYLDDIELTAASICNLPPSHNGYDDTICEGDPFVFPLAICDSVSTNLITNGGFESYSQCPTSQNNISYASPWKAVGDSPDYFNCSYTPIDDWDFINPTAASGNGYVGLGHNNGGGNEFIENCLSQPLITGSNYKYKFSIRGAKGDGVNVTGTSDTNTTVSLYGAIDNCINANSNYCISDDSEFILLGTIPVNTFTSAWSTHEFNFTVPQTIYSIAIGSNCGTAQGTLYNVFTTQNIADYYYYDDISITEILSPQTTRWYENDSGTGIFYTGSSVSPSSTTTYYPFCSGSCLSASGEPITVTVECPVSGSGSIWNWTGCKNSDWFNVCNWDRGSIPTTFSNVIVPNSPNNPIINGGTADCFDITILSNLGAEVTITNSGFLNITKP